MQHDYFQKNIGLTFWPRHRGRGCVCGQNICYHVAASVVSFNFICNMTIFWFGLGPTPKCTQWAQTQAFTLKSRLICFISIAALPACQISAKNIYNCLSYCENKIFDLWPLRWGQRRWGKTFDNAMLIYSHLAIMAYSEKLLDITITHVSFIALTLAGSLGRCLNSFLRTRQMLIHKKTCVIPIFLHGNMLRRAVWSRKIQVQIMRFMCCLNMAFTWKN